MTLTMDSGNGKVRKNIASQLDRLDATLDGLAEGLNEAVADAVKAAVEVAVKEAVKAVLHEVLSNADLVAKLRGQSTLTHEVNDSSARARPNNLGLWQRLSLLCQGVRGCLVGLYQATMTGLGQLGCWVSGVWQKSMKGLASLWRQCQIVKLFKFQLLAALGVGGLVAVGAWYAGPWLSVLMSGVGGFAASVAVQGWLWLRNALGLQTEQAA